MGGWWQTQSSVAPASTFSPDESPPDPQLARRAATEALGCPNDEAICSLHRICLDGTARVCTNAGTLWLNGHFMVDGRKRPDLRRAAAAFALACDLGDELGCTQLDGMWADDRAPYDALIPKAWRATHKPYPWIRDEWRPEWGPLPHSPNHCG